MNDFLIEKRLNKENKELFNNYKNVLTVMNTTLDKIASVFGDYTNHSMRHCLNVLEFCDNMIGEENINKLNTDEIYILMCASIMHDFGMTVSKEYLQKYQDEILPKDYLINNPNNNIKDIIRDNHHLISEHMILFYKDFFEFPSEKHAHCVALISKGHRKVDLFNKEEYDPEYKLDNGNTVCLPYLASLIRLADELDIAYDRNQISEYFEHMQYIHWRKHLYIKHLNILEDKF